VGRTFKYTENGPVGLSGGRRIIIASTRGGMYSAGPASAMDYQEAYLKAMFGFLGITDVRFVRAERLTKGGDISDRSRSKPRARPCRTRSSTTRQPDTRNRFSSAAA
jgi:FMN-dependent NADH-azoreductase